MNNYGIFYLSVLILFSVSSLSIEGEPVGPTKSDDTHPKLLTLNSDNDTSIIDIFDLGVPDDNYKITSIFIDKTEFVYVTGTITSPDLPLIGEHAKSKHTDDPQDTDIFFS